MYVRVTAGIFARTSEALGLQHVCSKPITKRGADSQSMQTCIVRRIMDMDKNEDQAAPTADVNQFGGVLIGLRTRDSVQVPKEQLPLEF